MKKKHNRPKIVDGRSLTLDQWLIAFMDPDVCVSPPKCFPSDALRKEYLATITIRSEDDVRRLLFRLLPHSGTYELDGMNLSAQIAMADTRRDIFLRAMEHYYFIRMIRGDDAWEGLTWLLDLLSTSPRQCIDTIDAYVEAHNQVLNDGMWNGLIDARAIIRSRFISYAQPMDVLYDLGGHGFEQVVAAAYARLGYDCLLTQLSHDGGADIIATRKESGRKQDVVIQCKCSRGSVGVTVVRELLGVVSDKKAQKGILVTPGCVSKAARALGANNDRIELLDGMALSTVLNEGFGTMWPRDIDSIKAYAERNIRRLKKSGEQDAGPYGSLAGSPSGQH